MLREELERRLGYCLENWQWEMAHYVYQNHPQIDNVKGKDQIAALIKENGFRSDFVNQGAIRAMYADLKGPTIIRETCRDMYTTYDVTHEGYCVNTRGNLVYDIFKEVKATLKKEYPKLAADWDSFSYSAHDEYKDEKVFRWNHDSRWLVIHYVKGGSEGYWVHVATVDRQGKYEIVFLSKTLLEGEMGRAWGEQMVAALSRIMEV